MHKKGVVHRDIKLDNILISKITDGEYDVKIADFGLARLLPPRDERLYDICGTACYIAPEVFDEKGYREKCDIFSVGSVAFNLFTGRYLFNGKTPSQTLFRNQICDLTGISPFMAHASQLA
jgi:serine/threonine protein kinase